jgi:hypothetical protein
MSDPERRQLSRFVYEHLRHPDFRRRLEATVPDGTKPIKIVLPSDQVRDLRDRPSMRSPS